MSTIVSDLVSHLQCGVAIAANDAVYISNVDGKIYKYDPLDPTQVFAGIAKEAGLLNAFIRVVQSGRVKGFTGLTPGQFVYASVTVPGGFQLTDPGSTLKVVLGIAKSATELTVNGALGIKPGGDGTGSGSLDTILQLTATEQLTDWSTGNNATVLGGGVLAGSFVKETSTPLHGSESYKYTQAAGSLNDYLSSKAFPVDLRFRAQQVYLTFPYQYDGLTGDIQAIVYCNTTAAIITSATDVVQGTAGATQSLVVSCVIPATCTGVRVGFHVKALNSGKIFSFDDISLSTSLLQSAQLNNVTDWQSYTPTFTGFGTAAAIEIQSRRNGSDLEIRGKFTSGTPTATEARISFPTGLVSGSTALIPSLQYAGEATRNVAQAGTLKVLIEPSVSYITFSLWDGANSGLTKANGNTIVSVGNLVSFTTKIPIQGWTAGNTAIVTPTQQVSSDTLPFTFKATAIVDADPVGTFNTYTYAASGNTPTISGSAPTQTIASMNTDGFRVFGRVFTAASTTASPARFDVKIGKGLKSWVSQVYAGLAKTTPLAIDNAIVSSNNDERGAHVTYNEVTGVLSIDAGIVESGGVFQRYFWNYMANTSSTSGYVVFNASTSPSIAALPILQPRIATLSHVLANGTNGGSTVAGVVTRPLNTIVDTTGIVTSLTANQFTLPAGTYYIDCWVAQFLGTAQKVRIQNITDATTQIQGQSNRATADTASTLCVKGEIIISSPKVFEVQQYSQVAVGSNGLGVAASAGPEVFAQIEILKIR